MNQLAFPTGVYDNETLVRSVSRDRLSSSSDGDESHVHADGLSYNGRVFVFLALSLGVQAFMSFSGGATPASLPAIQAACPGLTGIELGLLGSLDKIGQVVASPFWGRALQRCPTKVLLIVGLFLNAGFSAQFGFVSSKWAMFIAKFMQGCTESQQIVWGNLWTTYRAPAHLLSTWMNMGGVAAGAGTAVGQAVAGYGIQGGMPYCFAYAVQAGCLLLLWVALVCTPNHLLALPRQQAALARDVDASHSANGSVEDHQHESVIAQVRVLMRQRLYLLTMLCVAQNNFIVGGFQFFWTRFFCTGPWTLDLGTVTTAGLLVQGLGMGLGIFLGPMLVNRYGGYSDHLGRYVTLHLLTRITAVCVFGAGLAVLSLGFQLSAMTNELMDGSKWNPWLWLFWLATLPINFGLAAQGGVQTVINIGCVPAGMQELAQGFTTSVQFFFGYAGGVMIPSMIVDMAYPVSMWLFNYKMTKADQLAVGVFVLCCMCPILLVTVRLARDEAFRLWQLKEAEAPSRSAGASSPEGSSEDENANDITCE